MSEQEGQKPEQQQQQKLELKVGERIYTPEVIQALEEKVGSLGKLETVAQRYGLSPEAYAGEAENAFGIVAALIEQGALNPDGSLKQQQQRQSRQQDQQQQQQQQQQRNDPVAQALSQLSDKFTAFEKRVGEIESGQTRLFQNAVVGKIKGAHGNLSDEDVDWVMRTAAREKGKPIMDIAKQRADLREQAKRELRGEIEKELAKEYGLDFEALNKSKGIKPEDVTVATVIGDKKLSFRGGEKTVKPGEALRAFLDAKER